MVMTRHDPKNANIDAILTPFFLQQSDIQLVWIYGSVARGEETEASDLDVAVAGHQALTPARRVELAQQISQLVMREVDLVDLLAERGVIQSQVLTQGRLLLKKDTRDRPSA